MQLNQKNVKLLKAIFFILITKFEEIVFLEDENLSFLNLSHPVSIFIDMLGMDQVKKI